MKGESAKKIDANNRSLIYLIGFLSSFLILLFTLTPANAEIIDGPANIRVNPKGKIILSLNNGVHVNVVSTQSEWFLIGINALVDKNSLSAEGRVQKGVLLYDELGSEMGKTVAEIDIKKSLQKNGKYVVFIEGYTFKGNIIANSADRNKKPEINCSGIARQLQKELNEPTYKKTGLSFESCSDLEHAIEIFSLAKDSNNNWVYIKENALRQQLREKYGAQIPFDILVTGYIERAPPDTNAFILVLGIDKNSDRAWPVGYIASEEKRQKKIFDRLSVTRILLEGWSPFSKIGFYPTKEPHVTSQGEWVDVSSADGWSILDPMRKQARACLPCQGWLCDDTPLICFTDFNQNGREEIQIKGHAEDFDSLIVFEVDANGKLRKLLDLSNSAGHWKKWQGEWIFVGGITCEGGEFCGSKELGNPNCVLPSVYRFDKSGLLQKDPVLVNEFYPVEEREAPPGCSLDKPEIVNLPSGKFVRYLPRKKLTGH